MYDDGAIEVAAGISKASYSLVSNSTSLNPNYFLRMRNKPCLSLLSTLARPMVGPSATIESTIMVRQKYLQESRCASNSQVSNSTLFKHGQIFEDE